MGLWIDVVWVIFWEWEGKLYDLSPYFIFSRKYRAQRILKQVTYLLARTNRLREEVLRRFPDKPEIMDEIARSEAALKRAVIVSKDCLHFCE